MASTSSTGVAPPGSPNTPEVVMADVQQSEVPINPVLLAAACCGDTGELNSLFSREDAEEPPMTMLRRSLTLQQASGDIEHGMDQPALPSTASEDVEDDVDQPALPAAAWLLDGITAEGNTALHAVATNGDSAEFLECASIINKRDIDILFVVNRNGDTPLHCAARSGNPDMLSRLIELAGNDYTMHEFLRKENVLKETALHDAVRIGNQVIVERLLAADPELALYPVEGSSPLYLAILQRENIIARRLYDLSHGNLSYDGPQGKTALHVATFRGIGTTKLMLDWNKSLTAHADRDGSTPLHLASSLKCPNELKPVFRANKKGITKRVLNLKDSLTAHGDRHGSTPLDWHPSFNHSVLFVILLEEYPAAVYQADNKGLFPIHVAASVGEEDTIRIILDKYPSSGRLRTAQGRTFLHVAVEKGRLNIVSFVCGTPSLDWILNMRDNDGNTALHLAVQHGKLRIFLSLYGNKKVNICLANNNQDTPIDISQNLLPCGMKHNWSNEMLIYWALTYSGINHIGLRGDHHEEKYSRKLKPEDRAKEEEKVKDSSQILGIS